MFDATEGDMWRIAIAGAIILGVLACGLWGMATNNDSGSAAAVTPVPVEVTEEPAIDVGDDGANQIIDDTLEVLNSANSVLACTQQFNAKELSFGEYCKCMANSEPDDSTGSVSPELQGCLDWCEGCYVEADVTLNAGCTINETHLSGCYTHCVSEYGD